MLGDIKRLGRETVIYGLSTVLARLLNFLLIPLYTHLLVPEEMGVMGALFAYMAFANVLFLYGLDFALMRKSADRPAGDRTLFSTACWSVVSSSLVFSSAIHAFSAPLSSMMDLGTRYAPLLAMAAWTLACDAVSSVIFAQLRMEHRASTYAALKTANIATNLALNVVLVAWLDWGLFGVFAGTLGASVLTLLLLLPPALRRLAPAFEPALWRAMLGFSLPLFPGALAAIAVQVVDRLIVLKLMGKTSAGIYQVNYKLAILMMMAVNMFDAAWRPFFLQRFGQPKAPETLARVMTYFATLGCFLFLAMSLFIPHLVALPLAGGKPLIDPSYWEGLAVVPLVALGYLFNGLYINLLAAPALSERTALLSYATILGATINVGANFLWIPRWGIMGAAAATLAAYLSMALSLYFMSRRTYPIPYEWGRLFRVAACLAACLSAAWAMEFGMSPDRAAARLILCLGFPIALVFSGFLLPEEKQALSRIWPGLTAISR
ncbi:MAG: lipopolysaccharide biosynthesis protein [Elusimicrobia bacterium]|nr:lipopolysaccharide biosynthesis protein [Elusimicrobiota bacterium]